ncbi:MAG: serine/threonine-protein kinase [Polyangia bacterium]
MSEASPAAKALQVGDSIGRFKLVRRIGAGGMGEVFEALHDQIQRRAAIKVLAASFAADRAAVQRFLNEARITNVISHPSLANVYELGETAYGAPYIVMEYLDGETLRQRLARRGTGLPPLQAMRIARQTASALAAVHEKGVVHRDLSPANIMLVPDADMPDGERVKVLDFGIAKLTHKASPDQTGITATNISMGTPRYMSPEQARSARDVTDRSDVYTLGLILYEMLAGSSPWSGLQSDLSVMAAQVNQIPPPLQSRAPDAPTELCALIMRMLDKKPEARPSAAEVAATLARMSGGPSSTAIPILAARPAPPAPAGPESERTELTAPLPAGPGTIFEPPKKRSGRAVAIGAASALGIGLIGLVVMLRLLLAGSDRGEPTVQWAISSDPSGADVVAQNGQVLGKTPFRMTRPLGTGTESFTLRHAGNADYLVTLDRGRDSSSDVALRPLPVPKDVPVQTSSVGENTGDQRGTAGSHSEKSRRGKRGKRGKAKAGSR